jgi:hypothetical protein
MEKAPYRSGLQTQISRGVIIELEWQTAAYAMPIFGDEVLRGGGT